MKSKVEWTIIVATARTLKLKKKKDNKATNFSYFEEQVISGLKTAHH